MVTVGAAPRFPKGLRWSRAILSVCRPVLVLATGAPALARVDREQTKDHPWHESEYPASTRLCIFNQSNLFVICTYV